VGNLVDPATGQKRALPWAWNEFRLCRDIYHCTPSELDEQEWDRVRVHIAIFNIEAEAEELRRQHARKK
jgi:hypothetical protein